MLTFDFEISAKNWSEAEWQELHELDGLCFNIQGEIDANGDMVVRAWPMEFLQSECCQGFVIRVRDRTKLVAGLIGKNDGGRLHITSICVHPDFRRQHIATRLLELSERFGRLGNFKAMFLEYRNDFKELPGFYHKFGFVDMKGPCRRRPGDPQLSLKELWRARKFAFKSF